MIAAVCSVAVLVGCSTPNESDNPEGNVASNHPAATESPVDSEPDEAAKSAAPEAGAAIPNGTYRSEDGESELLIDGETCTLSTPKKPDPQVCRVDTDRSVVMHVEDASGSVAKDEMPYSLDGDILELSNVDGEEAPRVLKKQG